MAEEREKPEEEEMEEALHEEPEVEVPTDETKEEEIAALKKELEEIRLKSDEYLDGWQRERAEFANFRKRVEREREQIQQIAAGNILKRYLEVVDDLDRALKTRPRQGEGAAWAAGIDLIYAKLLSILENEGVRAISAEGQEFDPNLHEAISHEESSGHESGQIIEVVQNGYLLGERVLRPARVRVAR